MSVRQRWTKHQTIAELYIQVRQIIGKISYERERPIKLNRWQLFAGVTARDEIYIKDLYYLLEKTYETLSALSQEVV